MHEPTLDFSKLKAPDGTFWTPEKLALACEDKLPDKNTQAALSKLMRGFEKAVRLEDKGSIAAVEKMVARLSAGGYREDDFSETFNALEHMGGQVTKFALYKLDVDLQCFRAYDRIKMTRPLKKFYSMDEVFTVEELLEDSKLPFQQKQGEEITVETKNYGTAAKFSKFFIRDNTWADVPATLAKVPRYMLEHLTDQMWAQIFLATNYGRSSSVTPGTPYLTGIVSGDDTNAKRRDKRMIALNAAYMDMARTKVPLIRTDGTKVKVHGEVKYFAPFWQPAGEVLVYTSVERKATIDTDLAYFSNPDNAGADNGPVARFRTIGTTKDAAVAAYDDCIMFPPKGTHKYLPYTGIARGKDQSAMTFSTEYAFDWSHGLAHFGNIAAQKVFSGRIIKYLTTVAP